MTGRVYPLGRIERVLEPQVSVSAYYQEAIARAGGVGAVLAPTQFEPDGDAAATIEPFDALLVTGGADVDPSLYGEAPDPHTYGCDLVVDRFDMGLLGAAVDAAKPVLAICRGLQILNVWGGGSLHQHITGRPGLLAHGVPSGGGGSSVTVSVTPGTRLADALGPDRATGRCHHHQAINRVGHGLEVVARADDGVVEAVELEGPGWVVGVQWHPEDSASTDPVQQRLFDCFIAEARRSSLETTAGGRFLGEAGDDAREAGR